MAGAVNDQALQEDRDRLERALGYALAVIRSYQMDIRNFDWTGVDLVALGFCQGHIYTDAEQHIERLVKGEVDE